MTPIFPQGSSPENSQILTLDEIQQEWVWKRSGEEGKSINGAAELLFDFDTGPQRKVPPDGRKRFIEDGDRHASKVRSELLLPPFFDDIFLEEPRVYSTSTEELHGFDYFASAIVDEEQNDGIYGLAGVRGSGKSTALNLLEQYCYYPIKDKNPSLVVKFDLGVEFDPEQFSKDLVKEVARAAREQVAKTAISKDTKTGYQSSPGEEAWGTVSDWSGLVVRSMARFAHVTSVNLAWLFTAFMVLLILISQGREVQVGASGKQSHTLIPLEESLEFCSGEDCERAATTPLPTEVNRHSQSVTGVILKEAGTATGESSGGAPITSVTEHLIAAIERHLRSISESREPDYSVLTIQSSETRQIEYHLPILGKVYLPHVAFLLIVLGALFLVGIAYRTRVLLNFTDKVRMKAGTTIINAILVVLGVAALTGWLYSGASFLFWAFVVSTAVAVISIPRWWDTYLELTQFESSQTAGNAPPFELFGVIGNFLAAFLPRSDNREAVDKTSLPFVQENIKRVFNLCQCFNNIVVLIDDIDALPQEKHAQLLRIIRPLSKVSKVRCVLSVPIYYYHFMYGDKLTDLNSTLREVLVLGDSDIFRVNGAEMRIELAKTHSQERDRYLASILLSRYKLRTGASLSIAVKDVWDLDENKVYDKQVIGKDGQGNPIEVDIRHFFFEITRAWREQKNPNIHVPQGPKLDGEIQTEIWEGQLNIYQQSRREFIRLLARSAYDGTFLIKPDKATSVGEELRDEHYRAENLLAKNEPLTIALDPETLA